MNENIDNFIVKLIMQHKTVKEVDVMACIEQYLVHCKACDGNKKRIWHEGDQIYSCDIWKEAESLGLLPVGS